MQKLSPETKSHSMNKLKNIRHNIYCFATEATPSSEKVINSRSGKGFSGGKNDSSELSGGNVYPDFDQSETVFPFSLSLFPFRCCCSHGELSLIRL